jgi:hypothetical protein
MSEPLSADEHARWWKEAGGWQLRQLLYWKWDPIGVNDAFPWTHDEYDTYAGLIVARLRDGADAAEVARFLHEFEEQRMGLSPAVPPREVAQLIVEWYPNSIDWWRDRSLK